MTLQIRPLDPSLERAYEEFLATRADAMVYHSLRYRDYLREITGGIADYCVATDDGEVRGVLPMFYRDGAFGRVQNSLPFYGSHGGVLASDDEAAVLLMNHYSRTARDRGVVASTIVGNPLQSSAAEPPADLRDSRIGQFTRIAGANADSLMARFHQKTRNMVRKAEKSGVTVSVDSTAIGFLRETHEENLATLGGIAKPRVFFDALPRHFRQGTDYEIYVASHEGRRVAALLLFYFAKTVEYFTPATVNEHRTLQPMSAIIHRAMSDAAARGFELWNWGGTWSSQEGVYRFKSRWDAEDRPYQYFVTVNDRSILHRRKEELLDAYPYFFVVPFSALAAERETASASR